MSTHHHIAKTNGRNSAYSRARHRLRDIERIIIDRGGIQPDLVNLYLVAVATCFAQIRRQAAKPRPTSELLSIWCERWAPNLADAHLDDFVDEAASGKYQLKTDDDFGRLLHLSDADRTRLGIKTIGAYDVGKAARTKAVKARRRERDRLRAAAKRRMNGATPRAVYEVGSLSKTKPWEELGISRRQYERRRKKASSTGDVASASPHPSSIERGRTCDMTSIASPAVPLTPLGICRTKPPAIASGTSTPESIVGNVDGAASVGNPDRDRQRKTRFATSTRLDKEGVAYARACGYERDRIETMFEAFRDFNISERTYSADWQLCWENWVDRQVTIDNEWHYRQRRLAYFERWAA